MDVSEMERRFKAMYQELGLTPEQGVELGAQLVATEKAATAQGIAFKSAADVPETMIVNGVTYKAMLPPEEDMAATVPQEITVNGTVYKAAPPAVMEAIEEQADAPMEEMAEEAIEPEAEMTGDYLGDMTWDAFAAKLADLLAPVLKMQDMVKAMGDAHAELKTMYGGAATKEAGAAAELAALKSSVAELQGKIAQIEGDQPATILPDELEAALKSAGPTTPEEPAKKKVESTPERPWAGWGAKSFPELYDIGLPS